jgi:5,6,7,8-tetrahydromethanopterin hydro-lyase
VRTQIGEGFAGDSVEAAHVNTVLGQYGSPVEAAWTTALATPRAGHAAFVTVLRPGLPVQPLTLFVNKATIADDDHARLTWGAAQAGIACGVADAVAAGVISADAAADLLLIAAVWVNPAARDERLVFSNNRTAVLDALRAARDGHPEVGDVLAARSRPENPFFVADTPRGTRA